MKAAVDIVVIGGGATGLTVALELQQLGMHTMRDVVVLDAELGPGGSWRRAWDALPLRMATGLAEPEGLADFGLDYARADPEAPAREVVPRTLAYFEDASNLYVYRPARVVRVTSPRRSPLLHVEFVGPGGRERALDCRILIDASGHWSTPFVPWVPGMLAFRGRHIAAARLERMGELDGARVLVVGGGRTAVDLVRLLDGRTESLAWSTRRPPEFREAAAAEVVRPRGLGDLASATGGILPPWANRSLGALAPVRSDRAWIPVSDEVRAAIDGGLLRSAGPIRRITETGVEFDSGALQAFDAIVWATGSHSPLRHLAPLRLADPHAATRARSGWSRSDRRLAIIRDGPEATGAEALAHAVEVAGDAFDVLDAL